MQSCLLYGWLLNVNNFAIRDHHMKAGLMTSRDGRCLAGRCEMVFSVAERTSQMSWKYSDEVDTLLEEGANQPTGGWSSRGRTWKEGEMINSRRKHPRSMWQRCQAKAQTI